MNKVELKNGMSFVTREGNKCYVVGNEIYVKSDEGTLGSCGNIEELLNNYNTDLSNKRLSSFDIMKIYDIDDKLIWERGTVDWSQIPVDTKVLVKDRKDGKWEPRYFAEYKKGKVLTYPYGMDSWSSSYENPLILPSWNYYKLAEEPKEKLTSEQLEKTFDEICEKIFPDDCEGCKYEFGERCEFSWILDNYNVTEK